MSNYNLYAIKMGIEKSPDKRKEQKKEYKKIVKEIIKPETLCKIGAPGCTKTPSGLHHLQKRSPKNLLDKRNLVPCCSNCNGWIEENSKEAKYKGFTKSRFQK